MKKILWYTLLVIVIFLVGCQDFSKYDDEAIAAVIRGEELTVGELRFLYSDEQILDNLDGTIKGKLAIQEAKTMNIDVSEELQEMGSMPDIYPPEDIDTEHVNGMHEFAESQAEKFGIEPEAFYEKYMEKTQEISVYVIAYINEMIGEPGDNVEEYTESANQLLDDLVEENKDEIQIFIK